MTLRALLDANVLISALLALPRSTSTVMRIVLAGATQAYGLLLPEEVVSETLDAVATVPYLVRRIDPEAAWSFVDSLRAAAQTLPRLTTPPPLVGRDPKDDYLLAQAHVGAADYLVTGDKDLLALAGHAFSFAIVTPAEFLTVLEAAGLA